MLEAAFFTICELQFKKSLKLLTCDETRNLPGVCIIGDSFASSAHLHLETVEGQQLTPVVSELCVYAQQSAIISEIAKS